LEAFDHHFEPGAKTCTFPELPKQWKWLERKGFCEVGQAERREGVTVYTIERPGHTAADVAKALRK
jgi:hypothetical protein